MATASKDKKDQPARVLGPRPVFVLFEYDGEGNLKLDAQGKPVIGKVPEEFTRKGKGIDVEAGDPAVTRKSDIALELADLDPSLRFVRFMVK